MITKINNTDIRITKSKRKLSRRTSQNQIPGSISNPIDKMGFSGLSIELEAYALDADDYDTIIAELLSDSVKLYVRANWYYDVTVVDLDIPVEESDVGYFPFKAKFISEEPLMYSDELKEVAVNITENNQTFGGTSITTDGNIYSKPDIILTGSTVSASILSQMEKW